MSCFNKCLLTRLLFAEQLEQQPLYNTWFKAADSRRGQSVRRHNPESREARMETLQSGAAKLSQERDQSWISAVTHQAPGLEHDSVLQAALAWHWHSGDQEPGETIHHWGKVINNYFKRKDKLGKSIPWYRLMKGSDNRPGPRIAMAYNEEYHDFFLAHGRVPGPVAYSNTGVFLIKPGLITIMRIWKVNFLLSL